MEIFAPVRMRNIPLLTVSTRVKIIVMNNRFTSSMIMRCAMTVGHGWLALGR